jgi:site-specific DNA-cytosine methylase
MNLHPSPLYQPIPVKAVIPRSLGTRSQRINPWIPADEPAATICKTDAGYELKEAQIRPTCQSFRVLTGQEPKRHFGLVRLDPEKPCPTIQKSQPESSTTGLIHPYDVRHLTISEIKLMSSFPEGFRMEGRFHEKWARIGNSVPPLLMKAIADRIRHCLFMNKSTAR